jgi:uncharacterized cupin superfamily protein
MKKVNASEVPQEHRESPKGAYECFRKHISLALGGKKDQGVWAGGHPFDVELARLRPGKRNFPYHSHAAQWEYYIFISGSGRFLDPEKHWLPVEPGDHVICPPGEAHLLENDGSADLVYFVISDHHPADITTYPNTDKRQLKPEYRIVETTESDYYRGEE